MKTIVGTVAEVTTARQRISDARGYPKRGKVYRRDNQGQLQHVTGDRRYDAGTLATFSPVVVTVGTLAYFDVDTGVATIPPEVRQYLKTEAELPPTIKAARETVVPLLDVGLK